MARHSPIAVALILALSGTLPAADKDEEDIRRAIKGGQAYLKAIHRHAGRGPLPPGAPIPEGMQMMPGLDHGGASAALAGLALIESGVPADDSLVVQIARSVRTVSVSTTGTYQLSLFIMFLDRVGEKTDSPLIQFMTLRLLSGQCSDGSWSYQCNGLPLDPVEARALHADLTRGAKLATPEADPKPKKKEARPRTDLDENPRPPATKEVPPPAKEKDPEPKPGLHPSLEKYLKGLKDLPGGAGAGMGYGIQVGSGDHSNTQFATVALWCGRRHYVPVSDALTRLDKHFRQCQAADGGWGYSAVGDAASPSMTCAGLIGLAIGFGNKDLKDASDKSARIDAEAVNQDPVIQGGLKYVGNFLAAAAHQRDGTQFQINDLNRNLYFMWSLERVAMAYGLTTIGKVDWYDWGSKVLVRSQNRDGSWTSDGYAGAQPDNATAFALLFLSRANLAKDLASSMTGKVKDPGSATLRSPGDLNSMLGKAGKGSSGTKTEATTDPQKLADSLVASSGAKREELLAKYRDSKGAEFTDALVYAIPKLSGDAKAQARDALAHRCVRFTAATLNAMMADKDPEKRRAAALAAGAKGPERVGEFAKSLVELTADSDKNVVQAARAALKALSGVDHGPEPGAGDADRTAAVTAWRNWLARLPR